jgi:hypothetical protein
VDLINDVAAFFAANGIERGVMILTGVGLATGWLRFKREFDVLEKSNAELKAKTHDLEQLVINGNALGTRGAMVVNRVVEP